MTDYAKGHLIFLAALGMMLTLLAPEIAALTSWGDALAPVFVAKALAHIGVVIAAFVGGKLVPAQEKP